MEMKRCTYCKLEKELTEFNVRPLRSGNVGRRSYCKKCGNVAAVRWRKNHPALSSIWYRNSRYKKCYGITENEYLEKLKKQKNKCAICKEDASTFKNRLAVDHNHDNGAIRGLLCVRCNTGIGNLKNKKNLSSAIRYFNKYEER